VFSQTNLAVFYTRRLIGTTELNLNLNVINLFDQDTATGYNVTPYRDPINLANEAFFAGFDLGTAVRNTAGIRPDARFGQASAFQARREIRLGARITF
jgi:outer membrane receptor protein involved in Fe transport